MTRAPAVPPVTQAQQADLLARQARLYNRRGIGVVRDPGLVPEELAVYQAVLDRGELTTAAAGGSAAMPSAIARSAGPGCLRAGGAAASGPAARGTLVIEHAFLADAQARARAVRLGVGITVQHPLLYSLGGNLVRYWVRSAPARSCRSSPGWMRGR